MSDVKPVGNFALTFTLNLKISEYWYVLILNLLYASTRKLICSFTAELKATRRGRTDRRLVTLAYVMGHLTGQCSQHFPNNHRYRHSQKFTATLSLEPSDRLGRCTLRLLHEVKIRFPLRTWSSIPLAN